MKLNYVIEFVADMDRAVNFYRVSAARILPNTRLSMANYSLETMLQAFGQFGIPAWQLSTCA